VRAGRLCTAIRSRLRPTLVRLAQCLGHFPVWRRPLTLAGPGYERADAVVPTRRERCLHPSVLGETTPVAVKIKLKRMGKIHAPFYRIIVADARTKRDGRAIEEIGKYHPMSDPSLIEVDSDRAQHWLSVGAQPTDPVRKILEVTGDWQKFKGLPGAEGTLKTAAPKADKKDAYAAAVAEALGTGDGGKGKGGRKPAGKSADDQADGDAKASKPARAGGRQASVKADTAKADTAKADAKADTVKADAKADTVKADAKADTVKADAKADTAKADTAKADAKADTAKADTAKADTAKADTAKADTAKADTAKAKPEAAEDKAGADEAPAAKSTRASAKKDSAAKAEPAADAGEAAEAAATEQGNGA
jgi:small subunit ribosomal protein S16